MRRNVCLILSILCSILPNSVSYAVVEAPRNPDSAKECAICHYRWIDTFYLDGRGSDLVPYQQEKVVASVDMCFTCHDGSVVDSRAKVYNDKHHNTDKPPPEHMNIPKIFPLDEKGNIPENMLTESKEFVNFLTLLIKEATKQFPANVCSTNYSCLKIRTFDIIPH